MCRHQRVIDEGYTKYICDWQRAPALPAAVVCDLNEWRNCLCDAGLVGYDEEHGVGFGNLSIRVDGGEKFIVSGTQTGHIKSMDETHYSLVTAFDIDKNHVSCEGPVQASSEALTHAALYQLDEEICAIAHVHSLKLWQSLIHRVPTTAENVRYGTPEMAREFLRLYRETDLPGKGIAVMAGHEEGIISFGRTMEQAAQRILRFH
jgi:L-ribulose-5-phosphate 4-epimerase